MGFGGPPPRIRAISEGVNSFKLGIDIANIL